MPWGFYRTPKQWVVGSGDDSISGLDIIRMIPPRERSLGISEDSPQSLVLSGTRGYR